jgi:hypothetical protein
MGGGIKKVSGVDGGDISRNQYGLSHVRSHAPKPCTVGRPFSSTAFVADMAVVLGVVGIMQELRRARSSTASNHRPAFVGEPWRW